MKESEITPHLIPSQTSYYLFTEEFIAEILSKQDKILELLEKNNKYSLNGYITEKQAREILNKKTTWFWQMRKEGRLKYKNIGQTVYYLMDDINQLLKDGQ